MTKTRTLAQAQQWGREMLHASPSPVEDVRRILCHCIAQSSSFLLTWPEREMTPEQEQHYVSIIEKRVEGHPVAYLLGTQGFWDLELTVSPDTLIPRSETELLVELAISKVSEQTKHILDLGTGTGAIALAVARECPLVQVMGADFKPSITALAEHNRERNQVSNCQFVTSDWFSAIPHQLFDVIVSNPPYVETSSDYLQQGDLRFEPLSALTSGTDGLEDIKHIITNAKNFLVNGGWLMLEHGFNQRQPIHQLMVDAGYVQVECVKDYAGLDRITIAQCCV